MYSYQFHFLWSMTVLLLIPVMLVGQQVQKQPFTLTNKLDKNKYEGRIEVRTGMVDAVEQFRNGSWLLDFSQSGNKDAGIRVTFREKWLSEEDDFTDVLYLDVIHVDPGDFLRVGTINPPTVRMIPTGDGRSQATFTVQFNTDMEKYVDKIERHTKTITYHYEVKGVDIVVLDPCDDLADNCKKDLNCLRDYLANCSTGKHAQQVRRWIADIEAWENAQQQNNLIAFQTYLDKFPQGQFETEARNSINNLEQEEALWQKAKTNNKISDFEAYLAAYPYGKYANESRAAIKKLQPGTGIKPKPKPPAVPPADQVAWTALKESFDVNALRKFVSDFPESNYRKYAESRISRITKNIAYSPVEKGPETFLITLINVFAPQIDSIVLPEGVRINASQLKNNYSFEITYLDKEEHPIYIFDPQKNPEISTLMIPHLSELLQGQLNFSEDSLFFTFKHGEPPYQLDVKFDSLHIHTFNIPEEQKEWIITKAEFKKLFPGKAGTFNFEVWDKTGVTFANIKESYIVKPTDIPWEIIIGSLVLLVLIISIRNTRQRRRKKELQEKNEARKKQQQQEAVVMMDLVDNEDQSKEKNAITGKEETAVAETTVSTSRVKIKKIKKSASSANRQEQEAIAFRKTMQSDAFYKINLSNIWADTAVSDIYLSKSCIQDVDTFIRENNLNLKEETEGMIPEVGGFLMGHYMYDEPAAQYKLVVERFVPISPEFHNVYQLEFSTENLAVELGQIMDDFPDLVMIGWFHTHPGHGLFLSKPDLVIHNGFFKRPYQFAMEMDTETENLDTTFFTRKQNGRMNNVHDRVSASWMAWTEIEKFRRKKN